MGGVGDWGQWITPGETLPEFGWVLWEPRAWCSQGSSLTCPLPFVSSGVLILRCWVPISSWEPWTELPYCCPSLFHVDVGFLSPVLLFISCWWRAAFAHLCATGELWWHCRVVTWSLPPPGSSGKGRAEPPWDKFILQPFSSSSRSILCVFLIRLWGNLRAATTRCSLIFQPKFSVTRQERFRKVAHGGTCKLLWFITI